MRVYYRKDNLNHRSGSAHFLLRTAAKEDFFVVIVTKLKWVCRRAIKRFVLRISKSLFMVFCILTAAAQKVLNVCVHYDLINFCNILWMSGTLVSCFTLCLNDFWSFSARMHCVDVALVSVNEIWIDSFYNILLKTTF